MECYYRSENELRVIIRTNIHFFFERCPYLLTMITFLHTSPLHVDRFEQLVRKYHSTIPIQHVVKESILETALVTGQLDEISFLRTIREIKQTNPTQIICTCSTYGQLCDQLPNIERIDQPIAHHIVANYSTIALAYTAESTRAVSLDLLQKTAQQQGKNIRIVECDCTHCWSYFEANDLKRYEEEIAKTIRVKTNEAEVVFLAQASMDGAIQYLEDLEQVVVSSPEYGVKHFLQLLEG